MLEANPYTFDVTADADSPSETDLPFDVWMGYQRVEEGRNDEIVSVHDKGEDDDIEETRSTIDFDSNDSAQENVIDRTSTRDGTRTIESNYEGESTVWTGLEAFEASRYVSMVRKSVEYESDDLFMQ